MGLVCPLCKQSGFHSLRTFGNHVLKHRSSNRLPCAIPTCSSTFGFVCNLKAHISRLHADAVDEPTARPQLSNTLEQPSCSYGPAVLDYTVEDISETDDVEPAPTPNEIFLRFVTELGKNPAVTDATMNDFISETASLLQNIGSMLQTNITEAIANNANCSAVSDEIKQVVHAVFSQVTEPIDGIRNASLRKKFLTSNGLYSEPQQFSLGAPRYEQKRNNLEATVKTVAKYDNVCTVPIKQTLDRILSNESIQESLIFPNGENSEVLEHFFDGRRIKSLYNKIRKPFLVLELYYDEIEPGNPLGAKAAVNKIGNFYICLRNLPNFYNSCGANIHLVTLGYSGDFKQHGFKAIMEHLWTDLAELEDGIEVEFTRGPLLGKHTLPVVLGSVVGDNLAIHQALGFKQSFIAHRFCHNCLITWSDFRQGSGNLESTLRVKSGHDEIANNLSEERSKEFGINFHCPLNDLKYFHVTENPAADIMHDFLEGIIPMELSYILRQLIYVSKFFSLDTLNNKIKSFPYGRNAKSKKPSLLDEKRLRAAQPLKQYASQSATLLILLPLMIGPLVPETDPFFKQLIDLVEIWNMLSSPVINTTVAAQFQVNWRTHVTNFQSLFPDVLLTPKWHFVSHYYKIMLDSGPLYHQMCMRYETKNNFFSRAAKTMQCFKNVPYTLAQRNQRSGARQLLINGMDRNTVQAGPGMTVPYDRWCKTLRSCLPFSEGVFRCTFLEFRGTAYHKQDFVILHIGDDDSVTMFGRIETVICQENVWFFVVEEYNVTRYNSKFASYEIYSSENFRAIKITELKYHHVHDGCLINGTLFVPRKFRTLFY